MSGIGAWFAMKFGDRIGINDIPNHRSSHASVIPKGGGIGVLIVFIISSVVLKITASLWLTAFVIALISFLGGDKHRLSVKERLIFQFACTVFFLFFLLYEKQVPYQAYLIGLPISLFIVGTSNFYNFMDGIDGIAGISGVVCFSLLSYYSSISDINSSYGTLCLIIASSCLGFLCFNMPNAKVFLGDLGSVFLGFLFACIVIILSESITDFFVMAGFLAPFYFDEVFTMVVRIKDGDSLVIPHRKHIYQLLANEVGISHWKISLAYGLAQIVIGLSVIFIKPMGVYVILLTYLIYGMIFSLISMRIRKKVTI